MAKKKFSKEWIQQHINDPYVKMAQQKGYRARAAFKLIEILDTEKLMRRRRCGRRPGLGARQLVANGARTPGGPGGVMSGRIIALDMLPMEPVAGVEFIQGDFREDAVLATIRNFAGMGRP